MTENFNKIVEKHHCRGSDFIKVAGSKPVALLKIYFFTNVFREFS